MTRNKSRLASLEMRHSQDNPARRQPDMKRSLNDPNSVDGGVGDDNECRPLQGSVDQLREVWEETDGLDPQEFNPKTFFKLHGKFSVSLKVHKLLRLILGIQSDT